jgi:phosphodiesterase/alkaline phosphatase D-like protein
MTTATRYKINREDEPLRNLLASTSTYAIWDDHEVKNDFAGQDVDQAQMAAGREAFLEYLPIRQDATDPNRLYRSFKWGKDVELFILDERVPQRRAICTDDKGTRYLSQLEATRPAGAWPTLAHLPGAGAEGVAEAGAPGLDGEVQVHRQRGRHQ